MEELGLRLQDKASQNPWLDATAIAALCLAQRFLEQEAKGER